MASKFIAYCPKCLDRDLPVYMMPCAGCGFPPFWPHTYPNMFRADESYELKPSGEVVELQAVKPAVVRTVVITDDDFAPSGAGVYTVLPDAVVAAPTEAIVVVDEATQPEPLSESEMVDDDYYHCPECGTKHRYTSTVGKDHLQYLE